MSDDLPQNLTPSQEAALLSLLTGSTITAASKSAGVSRDTVHRWIRDDAPFQAEYNRRRNEIRESVCQSLERLAEKAVGIVAAQIEAGDPNAALSVLKGLGFLRGRPPAGRPELVDEVTARMEQQAMIRALGGF